jgi:ParB-like chromosome segregation protein Spo0J
VTAHEAAAIFPLMDGVELQQLAEDIRAHGLLEPIVLLDGEILDGRNRLRACEIAGVDPAFTEAELGGQTPTEYVLSHNLHRRHLTTAQRAALALDLLPRLEEEARERSGARTDLRPISDAGRSDEKAAELVGVGRSTVAAAKAIQKRDPEIVNRMRAGDLNVAQAAREAGFEGMAQGGGMRVLDGGAKDSGGRVVPIYYGKGDKWKEATEPLARYLAAQEKKGWYFGHCNPREAAKRVQTIDALIDGLRAARADLEPRSVKPRPFSAGGQL